MAQFCTKCGAPMAEGMRFCTSCGATVPAPPTPPAPPAAAKPPAPPAPPAVAAGVPPPKAVPAAPTPPPAPPVPAVSVPPVGAAPATAAPTTAAPPKSSSLVLKIVLAIVGIFVVLSMLGIGGCVYLAYRAKQKLNQFEKQARINFPQSSGSPQVHIQPSGPASAKPETGPAVNIDVPIYPGATPAQGGGEMSLGGGTFKVQVFTTDDSVDKVLSFYKDKLGSQAYVQESGNHASVQVSGSNGVVQVGITHDEASGKTKFTITRIGK